MGFGSIIHSIGSAVGSAWNHVSDIFEDLGDFGSLINMPDFDFSNLGGAEFWGQVQEFGLTAGELAAAYATGGLSAAVLAGMDITGMTDDILNGLGLSMEDRARIIAERERQRRALAAQYYASHGGASAPNVGDGSGGGGSMLPLIGIGIGILALK